MNWIKIGLEYLHLTGAFTKSFFNVNLLFSMAFYLYFSFIYIRKYSS